MSHRLSLGLAGIAGLSFFAYWLIGFVRTNVDPSNVATAFLDSIENGNWKQTFSLMSPEERKAGNWNEARFEALLNSLTSANSHFESSTFSLEFEKNIEQYARSYLVKCRTPGLENPSTWNLVVIRGHEKWYAQLDTLPLFLNRLHKGPRSERLRRLADAMEAVRLEKLVDFRRGAIITPQSLRIASLDPKQTMSAWIASTQN